METFAPYCHLLIQSAMQSRSMIVALAAGATVVLLYIFGVLERLSKWAGVYLAIAIAGAALYSPPIPGPNLVTMASQSTKIDEFRQREKTSLEQIEALKTDKDALSASVAALTREVGTQKARSAESLALLESKLKAAAEQLGKFDQTTEGLQRFTFDADVLFLPGSVSLECEYRERLARLAGYIDVESHLPSNNKLVRIIVAGHTDNTPINAPDRIDKNKRLSDQRATGVVDYLRSQGIRDIALVPDGKGMLFPKKLKGREAANLVEVDSLNMTDSDKASNRRVELIFVRERDHSPS